MEVFDLYDGARRPLGRTMTRGDLVPEGCYHLVADVLFLNDKGETLLQFRAHEKADHPDTWSAPGGYALRGEDTAAACLREVREELGFSPDFDKGKILWTKIGRDKGTIWDVFLLRQDIPIREMTLQREEVQAVQWVFPEKIKEDPVLWRDVNLLSYWRETYPYLCLESMRIRIPPGIYCHYKGGRYRVEGLALHSETLEPMVIYRALYGAQEVWTRPATMWNERVTVDGCQVPRFAWEAGK